MAGFDPVALGGTQTFEATRARTDRTWWLLAPNPFVILADAAPALPEETAAQRQAREARESRGEFRTVWKKLSQNPPHGK